MFIRSIAAATAAVPLFSSLAALRSLSSSPILCDSPKGQTAKFTLALCQLAVGKDKAANVAAATRAIKDAARQGAQVVTLPECFNSPYGSSFFPEYAEPIPGPTTNALSDTAKECGVYLIGGSIPERDHDGKLYNTCVVFDNKGDMVAKHRKVHLFDVDIPGGIRFKESETLSAGNSITSFATPWGKIGVAICYDLRFPELAMIAAAEGCEVLVYPGAFNTTTGPLHWELLLRGRAVDNQLFVAACSPSRDPSGEGYQAWGHSSVVAPMGQVLATCDEKPTTVFATIDLELVSKMRSAIPVYSQKRYDVYEAPKRRV